MKRVVDAGHGVRCQRRNKEHLRGGLIRDAMLELLKIRFKLGGLGGA